MRHGDNAVLRFLGEADEAVDRCLDKLAVIITSTRSTSSEFGKNEYIPAGYTYFGQFIAHDLSFNVPVGFPSQRAARERTPRLDMDSLYGPGPFGDPSRFARACATTPRCLFHLGETRPDDGRSSDSDLPRRTPAASSSGHQQTAEAQIFDPRNDENLFISQMTLLFMKIHNQVALRIANVGSDAPFEETRDAMVLAYENIVVFDYLKKLLHPKVHKDLMASFEEPAKDLILYKRNQGGGLYGLGGANAFSIPAEFWGAAFRIGHAMVQSRYNVNDTFNETTANNHLQIIAELTGPDSTRTPVEEVWLVDWNRFFFKPDPLADPHEEFRRGALNYSHPMILSYPNQFGHKLGNPEGLNKLAIKDLARSRSLGANHKTMRTAAQLIRDFPGIVDSADVLSSADVRTVLQRAQTKAFDRPTGLDPRDRLSNAELDTLTDPNHTPLSVYILAEAEVHGKGGAYLGPLGSRIVGETLIATITMDQDWKTRRQKAHEIWLHYGLGRPPQNFLTLLADLSQVA